MYHTIEFAETFLPDLEISRVRRPVPALIRQGTRLQAEVHPYVVDTKTGPVEVADLFLAEGTIVCRVPCRCFALVEECACDEPAHP